MKGAWVGPGVMGTPVGLAVGIAVGPGLGSGVGSALQAIQHGSFCEHTTCPAKVAASVRLKVVQQESAPSVGGEVGLAVGVRVGTAVGVAVGTVLGDREGGWVGAAWEVAVTLLGTVVVAAVSEKVAQISQQLNMEHTT